MNGQGSAFVLRDIPIFLWVFGLIFMGVGIMIIYESGSPKIFALILIALGLGTLLFSQCPHHGGRPDHKHAEAGIPFGDAPQADSSAV